MRFTGCHGCVREGESCGRVGRVGESEGEGQAGGRRVEGSVVSGTTGCETHLLSRRC